MRDSLPGPDGFSTALTREGQHDEAEQLNVRTAVSREPELPPHQQVLADYERYAMRVSRAPEALPERASLPQRRPQNMWPGQALPDRDVFSLDSPTSQFVPGMAASLYAMQNEGGHDAPLHPALWHAQQQYTAQAQQHRPQQRPQQQQPQQQPFQPSPHHHHQQQHLMLGQQHAPGWGASYADVRPSILTRPPGLAAAQVPLPAGPAMLASELLASRPDFNWDALPSARIAPGAPYYGASTALPWPLQDRAPYGARETRRKPPYGRGGRRQGGGEVVNIETLNNAIESATPGTGKIEQIMHNTPFKLKVTGLTAIMGRLTRAGAWQSSLEVYMACGSLGLRRDQKMLNAALDACGLGCQWDFMLDILQNLAVMHDGVDRGTCRAIFGHLRDRKEWLLMAQVVTVLLEHNVPRRLHAAELAHSFLDLSSMGSWQLCESLFVAVFGDLPSFQPMLHMERSVDNVDPAQESAHTYLESWIWKRHLALPQPTSLHSMDSFHGRPSTASSSSVMFPSQQHPTSGLQGHQGHHHAVEQQRQAWPTLDSILSDFETFSVSGRAVPHDVGGQPQMRGYRLVQEHELTTPSDMGLQDVQKCVEALLQAYSMPQRGRAEMLNACAAECVALLRHTVSSGACSRSASSWSRVYC